MENKREVKQYHAEYKVKAIELANEIGQSKASAELGVPVGTLHGWIKATKKGELDMGIGTQNPETGLTLVEELKKLKEENKAYQKAITQLRKENAFLEEASAFFAASRQRLTKEKD